MLPGVPHAGGCDGAMAQLQADEVRSARCARLPFASDQPPAHHARADRTMASDRPAVLRPFLKQAQTSTGP